MSKVNEYNDALMNYYELKAKYDNKKKSSKNKDKITCIKCKKKRRY